MVGHTGNLDATIKAVETIDECVGKVIEAINEVEGVALITADHGNCEQMIDYKTGETIYFSYNKSSTISISWYG